MTTVKEIPDLVIELIDLSKAYLRQEALEPARRLGRQAGFGLGAAVLFAIGSLLLSVAGLRLLNQTLLPSSALWSVLGYAIVALVAAAVTGVLAWSAGRR